MIVYNQLEQRDISGLGTIRLLEVEEARDYRVLVLLGTVIRFSTNRYVNNNWFPPRERIATLNFRRAGVVMRSEVWEFPAQQWFDYFDPGGQVLVATQCAYKGTLQTFFNLGNALGLPSISINNDIKDYVRLTPQWDEVVVKCYADTAVRVALFGLSYENCGTDSGNFQPAFIPPEPPPEVTPGTPITVSDPYDGVESGEPYQPAPIDIPPEPPEPDPCVITPLVVTRNHKQLGIASFNITVTTPARIEVINRVDRGRIQAFSSTCVDGVPTGEPVLIATLDDLFGGGAIPGDSYLSVTVSDPSVPIVNIP